jgi:hypothetical protein
MLKKKRLNGTLLFYKESLNNEEEVLINNNETTQFGSYVHYSRFGSIPSKA